MKVRSRRSVAALVVVLAASGALVAAGAAAEPGLAPPSDWPREPSGDHDLYSATDRNHSASGANATATLNVTVGAQLSTVIETRARDVHTDVGDAGFSFEYETGDRQAAVTERFEELRERAEDVRADYEDVRDGYENGDVSREEYARRLATLHGEAEQLRRSLLVVRVRADDLSAPSRSEAGIDEAALGEVADDLEAVEGTGHRALLARYTGHGHGRFEFDVDAGLRIEARNADGEGFRSIRRSGDDSRDLRVDRDDALETALDALSDRWNWTLDEEHTDEFDGEYHFEFTVASDDEAGGAEVRVDGSSGRVVDLEEGVVSREDDRGRIGDGDSWLDDRDSWFDHPDHDWHDDSRDGWLDGDRDRVDGDHGRNRSDDERDRGRIDDRDRGWFEGDRDRDWFEDDHDVGDDSPWTGRDVDQDDGIDLTVTDGPVEPGETVTVAVHVDGNATADVPVAVDGEDVGETDGDGRLTVTLPDADEIALQAEWDGLEAEHEYEFDGDRGFWGR